MRSFDEMTRLFDEMNRAMEQFRSTRLTEFGTARTDPMLESGSSLERGWTTDRATPTDPMTSLEEHDDAYVFVMDLPGFEKADIDLTFDDGTLSVHAQTDVETDTDTARTVRSRRVSRAVHVPADVVTEEITATYHNGVLEVQLPLVEDERIESGHRIDIE